MKNTPCALVLEATKFHRAGMNHFTTVRCSPECLPGWLLPLLLPGVCCAVNTGAT